VPKEIVPPKGFTPPNLEHPWNKTLSLWGDFQQFPGVKVIELSGDMERAMGIESLGSHSLGRRQPLESNG
jgi:hypothetical protein